LPPQDTVRFSIELLDQGRPFSAHEVFEARWKDAPEAEHDPWQGLAQLCVRLTHALRGNATGARRVLERGNGRLERYAATGAPTYGLDLAEFRTRTHHGRHRLTSARQVAADPLEEASAEVACRNLARRLRHCGHRRPRSPQADPVRNAAPPAPKTVISLE
jgi:hypothetical protein